MSTESVFEFADELGPLKVIHVYEPRSALRGVLVVDNVAAGPSIGGVRMAEDVTAAECFRLARAMTLKNAAAGLPHGGGKAVLVGDPRMPTARKERLVRAFACALREVEQYIFAPDMGTDEHCMAWIKDEIGRVVGLPRELGGIPLDEIGATGWGLRHAIEAALEFADFQLDGARLVVQGYGAVGRNLAHFLAEQGAVLVGVADSGGAVADPAGLDLATLDGLTAGGGSVADYPGLQRLESAQVLDVECEIWVPAARPDVINEGNVDRLRARMVAQGANIPCTPGAERLLHQRGVLCLPDFIANAGGVICAAMEYQGAAEGGVFDVIAEKIRRNITEVLTRAVAVGVPPREAAMEMALSRVRRMMSWRRWSLF